MSGVICSQELQITNDQVYSRREVLLELLDPNFESKGTHKESAPALAGLCGLEQLPALRKSWEIDEP